MVIFPLVSLPSQDIVLYAKQVYARQTFFFHLPFSAPQAFRKTCTSSKAFLFLNTHSFHSTITCFPLSSKRPEREAQFSAVSSQQLWADGRAPCYPLIAQVHHNMGFIPTSARYTSLKNIDIFLLYL